MNRVVFLVDGFNLYHSIRAAADHLKGVPLKWLDLSRLCRSYLHVVGDKAQLHGIHYFSALATHRQVVDPDVIRRHECLLECLRVTGVHVELGRFKRKDMRCPTCQGQFTRHEEKETDVAIAVKLLELFLADECDTVMLVTGDTDLAPAIRTTRRLFPRKRVICAFPYGRKNKELAAPVTHSFVISKESYARCQLPDPFVCPDGRLIHKPLSW